MVGPSSSSSSSLLQFMRNRRGHYASLGVINNPNLDTDASQTQQLADAAPNRQEVHVAAAVDLGETLCSLSLCLRFRRFRHLPGSLNTQSLQVTLACFTLNKLHPKLHCHIPDQLLPLIQTDERNQMLILLPPVSQDDVTPFSTSERSFKQQHPLSYRAEL